MCLYAMFFFASASMLPLSWPDSPENGCGVVAAVHKIVGFPKRCFNGVLAGGAKNESESDNPLLWGVQKLLVTMLLLLNFNQIRLNLGCYRLL